MEIYELLKDPDVLASLKRIVEYEERREEEFRTNPIYQGLTNLRPFWDWKDVRIPPHLIKKLILSDVVEPLGRRDYVLKDRESVKRAISEAEEVAEKPIEVTKEVGIPLDLFDVIEGYDDLKAFLMMSLNAKEPVHALLVGPPSTAKSLFLMELERVQGSHFVTAGTATKAGIRDVIYDLLPRVLIVDEIDKIGDQKDLAALLSWMESGRVVITKHGLIDEKRGRGWVYAACNSTKGLPPELLDRFQVFHIRPYTPEQFKRVVVGCLVKRYGVDADLAEYIAEKVGSYTVSVREAVRISRMAKTKEDVDKIIQTIAKYRGG